MPYRFVALAIVGALAAEASAQPVDTDAVGPVNPPLPVAMSNGRAMAFVLPGDIPATVALMHGDGSCAFDHALVAVKVGKPTSAESFAEGYWKTIFKKDNEVLGCLDVRDGYITVVAAPADQLAALSGVLAAVRYAAYARHGEPISNAVDPMVLPRTQQRVSAVNGSGMWKAVDGARYDTPGGDALLSTFPLGIGSTMYVIGVAEGPCKPGTVAAPADVKASLFPPELGEAWIDDDQYKLRWKAWTCLADATLTVMSPIAGDRPPEPGESSTLKAMVSAVARSYGVTLAADEVIPALPPGGGGSYRSKRGVLMTSLGYFGVISFEPESARGGLFGLSTRVSAGGRGLAFAFDVELGYGNSEWLGEVRTGIGIARGRRTVVDVVVGGAVGSTGPAAAIDLYGEASITLPWGERGGIWLGGLHAIGVGGLDHSRGEARLLFGGKRDTTYAIGARYVHFPDDNGSAILVTAGGGALVRE